jgi:hypothetical protein
LILRSSIVSRHGFRDFVYLEIVTLHRSVAGPRLGAVLVAVGLCLVLSSPSAALETDQYYAWGRSLEDATDVVNAKLNLELQRAIASFEDSPGSCTEIAVRFRTRMRYILFHHVQTWAMNTALIERVPGDEESVGYRRGSMYGIHGPLDVGMWMPMTPTISVDGVLVGTDKLSHFISSGWTYFGTYNRAIAKGADPAEAEAAAVHRGITEESLILGAATSGILSIADLEASLQGMHFYLDLCSDTEPILERTAGGWTIRRPVDLADYVHPGWDESYRTSIFQDRRWKKVEPRLQQYCPLLDDPVVAARYRRYRAEDRRTAVGEAIDEMVREGRLPDPERFRLEAVCGRNVAPAPKAAPPDEPAADPRSTEELTELIVVEERSSELRAIPIAALRLSYPQIASLSYGVLFSRQPAASTCRTPCDFWGGFGQLEPGLGGGKLSLGWGRVIGQRRPGLPFLSSVYLAMAGKATLLRTWGSSSPLPENQTYIGPEFEFSIAKVNMGVGLLGRVRGDDGRDWVVTGHLGWGF